jgi:hypothetical protein
MKLELVIGTLLLATCTVQAADQPAMPAAKETEEMETDPLCEGAAAIAKEPADQEAAKAANKSHKLVFENADVRVFDVTIAPGEKEPPHYHKYPAVLVIDAFPQYTTYDKDGKAVKPRVPRSRLTEFPLIVRQAPQETHSIHNTDTKPFHAIRIEYKKRCTAP